MKTGELSQNLANSEQSSPPRLSWQGLAVTTPSGAQVAASVRGQDGSAAGPSRPALPCSEPRFTPLHAAKYQDDELGAGWGVGEAADGRPPRGGRDTSPALTSLQLGHPLQQRVQGALRLLAVGRGLVVEQGPLVLQLGHLAQQLSLQLPQPPLEHLPKVAGQHRVGHVRSELVLSDVEGRGWGGGHRREKN